MKTLRLAIGAMCFLFFSLPATAESLWENGNPENPLLNASYHYTIMDDFYVPGAGWWLERAEIFGWFVSADEQHTGDVNIRILPADPLTGEPDPSQAINPSVSIMTDPIDNPAGLRIRANMPKLFLKGQRRYWIEFDISSVKNVGFRGYSSDSSNLMPAYGNLASGSYQLDELDGDLAFNLYGSSVKTIFVPTVDDFKVGLLNNGDQSSTLRLVGKHSLFNPGMYQIQATKRGPTLYRVDNEGKHIVDFKVKEGTESTKFSTPLGDDLCQNVPADLWNYCQNFVACAAYEFCGDLPIP